MPNLLNFFTSNSDLTVQVFQPLFSVYKNIIFQTVNMVFVGFLCLQACPGAAGMPCACRHALGIFLHKHNCRILCWPQLQASPSQLLFFSLYSDKGSLERLLNLVAVLLTPT